MNCTISQNVENCTCTYMSCSKRGHCCECISYHKSKNEIPGCLFTKDGEKTYDRSLENFIKTSKI